MFNFDMYFQFSVFFFFNLIQNISLRNNEKTDKTDGLFIEKYCHKDYV